ncbi:MAG: endonuclease VIII [Clostridiaceae bacterium]|nr:endonuclease VIII [Clostridiaceae bacterium]
MLELPDAYCLAAQLEQTIRGKRIADVVVAHSPHKFAWYHGDPQSYRDRLDGRVIGRSTSFGGFVEIEAEDRKLVFGDGVALRFHPNPSTRPGKHQLLVVFSDATALSASVQMYGGLWCFDNGPVENAYYQGAQQKPSPLSVAFDRPYFTALISAPGTEKLSAKALLATEQRIPGLGNGALQDILYHAGIHPRKKVADFSPGEIDKLYDAIKTVLADMVSQGGRDTEKDLFGNPGGYRTRLSKMTVGSACPVCGATIRKEAYMGGSIYYCGGCQPHPSGKVT